LAVSQGFKIAGPCLIVKFKFRLTLPYMVYTIHSAMNRIDKQNDNSRDA